MVTRSKRTGDIDVTRRWWDRLERLDSVPTLLAQVGSGLMHALPRTSEDEDEPCAVIENRTKTASLSKVCPRSLLPKLADGRW